jgi:TRAP-type C4-dicarboxylate transport system substrate-binding protein
MLRLLTLIAAIAGITGFAGPAAAEKWNMASGYPDANYHTQNIKQFVDDVQKATGGKLEIALHTNQSLFKLPETKRAVQSAQVHLGELLIVQFGNEDPIFEASAIPFLSDTFPKARKLWDASKPATTERLAKQGIRLLYSTPAGSCPADGVPLNGSSARRSAGVLVLGPIPCKSAPGLRPIQLA